MGEFYSPYGRVSDNPFGRVFFLLNIGITYPIRASVDVHYSEYIIIAWILKGILTDIIHVTLNKTYIVLFEFFYSYYSELT